MCWYLRQCILRFYIRIRYGFVRLVPCRSLCMYMCTFQMRWIHNILYIVQQGMRCGELWLCVIVAAIGPIAGCVVFSISIYYYIYIHYRPKVIDLFLWVFFAPKKSFANSNKHFKPINLQKKICAFHDSEWKGNSETMNMTKCLYIDIVDFSLFFVNNGNE